MLYQQNLSCSASFNANSKSKDMELVSGIYSRSLPSPSTTPSQSCTETIDVQSVRRIYIHCVNWQIPTLSALDDATTAVRMTGSARNHSRSSRSRCAQSLSPPVVQRQPRSSQNPPYGRLPSASVDETCSSIPTFPPFAHTPGPSVDWLRNATPATRSFPYILTSCLQLTAPIFL